MKKRTKKLREVSVYPALSLSWPRLLAVNSANLFDTKLVGRIYCNLVHCGDNQICVNFHNSLQRLHIS